MDQSSQDSMTAPDSPTPAMAGAGAIRTMVLVVSLREAVERRQRFQRRAVETRIDWSFMDACSSLHPDLSYEVDEAVVAHGRALRPGELGCYSSHYEAWQRLLASDADQLFIFEDDVIVDWRYMEALATVDLGARGIDYLRFYFKRFHGLNYVIRHFIGREDHVVALKGVVYGTQGYAITRSGAKRLLEHCRVVRRPIDDELDRSWHHGVPNLAIFPSPLIEEFTASTIEGSRFDRHAVPPRLRLRRQIAIYREKLRRRLRHLTGRGKPRLILDR
jgi:glycosyl transferase family 25